jgi:hypothetical protein
MSTYTLTDLLHKWRRGELTAEQLAGHLLQHLLAHDERLTDVEKRLRPLEQAAAKPMG